MPEQTDRLAAISIGKFIKDNRKELVAYILFKCDNCETDDEEIEDWINNDEQLMVWATASGVNLNG